MNALSHRYETKGFGDAPADEASIEKIVAQFGAYHDENKTLFTGVKADLVDIRKHLDADRNALGKLEAKLGRPGIGGENKNIALEQSKALMLEFMRTGAIEGKTLSGASDPAGGYTLLSELDSQINDQLIAISPIRSIARIVTLNTGFADFKLPVGRRGTSSSWVGESSTRTATDTPILGLVTPPSGELMSYAKVTQWLIDDSHFNIEAWLQSNIADEHSYREGIAFISGDGLSKPEGILTGSGAPVNTADATRTFGVLKYFPSGASGDFVNADVLVKFPYDLTAPYRANARWLMNSNTAKAIRLLKDGMGNYLWQRALVAGQPDMLNGYPVTIAEDMPDMAANSLSIAFGDFGRGYCIVDRFGSRMVRDPYTTPGWINFYVFKRVGGALADTNAIRLMKFSAS